MKKMDIDFAPRTWVAIVYGLPRWGWLVSVVGALLFVTALGQMQALRGQLDSAHGALVDLQVRMQQRNQVPRTTATAVSHAQTAAVNTAIRQLNIPWVDLLDAIQAASNAKVAVIELNPDAPALRLRGLAEAKTSDDMIAYIERLKAQPMFGSVLLTSHEINEQDRNKPFRFEFVVAWKEF